MAKPELRDHRKFLKLRRLLGEPTPHVIGYLECLWHRGYQTGVPMIGDADDVEAAAEYTGERGKFAAAALEAGLIDLDAETGLHSIHDLYEHAPEYAKKRMTRKGTAPKARQPDGNQPPPPVQNQPPRGGDCPPRGGETGENPPAWRTKPRSEIQDPNPRTNSQQPPLRGESAAEAVGLADDPLKRESEQRKAFVLRWNAAGLKPLSMAAFGPGLQGPLNRNLLNPWWAENYPKALEIAGQSPFYRDGDGRSMGRLDPMDFLSKDDLVRQIIEGRSPAPIKVREPPTVETAEEIRRKTMACLEAIDG